jgi:hypothetical protein
LFYVQQDFDIIWPPGKTGVSIAFNVRLPESRVTRLGEFSPVGRLFTLGSVLKITELHSADFWASFSHGTGYVLIFANNHLGYSLGYFFTN